jgi:galactokinase
MNLRNRLLDSFEEAFGAGKEGVRVFFAPGRVNLIGEHTDYTGGYVFPAALDVGTWVVVRPRTDGKFRLVSTHFERRVEFQRSEVLSWRQEDDWGNYPKGMVWGLAQQGISVPGCDMLFHGNIPTGAGLSSSASIELATGVALLALAGEEMPMIRLVQLAQRVENEFVGVKCGIMDQFSVGMGKAGQAMLLKCDTLVYRYVPLVLSEYRLLIANTNKRRGLADSKYNERRRECEIGFEEIRKHLPGVTCLGDVTEEQWGEVAKHVHSPTIRKRLEHVVTENARVLRSTKALEEGDLKVFGQLMIQSHESLRDLYEVTGRELDALFEESRKAEGCIGTRMTGAGFGGCTVSIVHRDQVQEFQERVSRGYQEKTGLTPTFYVCATGDGAREVTEEV